MRKGPDGGPVPLRPGELAEDAVAEISSPDFPGQRLMVCLNPRLRAERRRKVEKHFEITGAADSMAFRRRDEKIAAEAALDGIYAIRTNLDEDVIGAEDAVTAYKSLSRVERAFGIKTGHPSRPVHVHTEDHVRAHVFLCLLTLYVEWHMRRGLAPLLFEDHDREAARGRRDSPVAPAEVSDAAKAKAASKRTPDGLPAHSFATLLADLATLTLNEVTLPASPDHAFPLLAKPTPLQERALELLDIDPNAAVAM